MNNIPDEGRRRCSEQALRSYGTAYIFEKRARNIRWKKKLLSFLGIAVPASIGVLIGSNSLIQNKDTFEIILYVAALVGLIQFILTIWALIAQWDEKIAYYQESKSTNYRLADEYEELGKTQILSYDEFNTKYKVLETEYKMRADLDNRQDITDKEKKIGMRAGLWKFRRPCAGCNEIPTTTKLKKCDGGVCGEAPRSN